MNLPYQALSDDKVFEIVHKFTAYWERDFGDYTNSSIDRGGLTRNGVTLGLLKDLESRGYKVDLNKDGVIDKRDILLVAPDIAKKIFHFEFWENGRAYCCPPLTAMVYYDFTVNSGPGNAARRLQMAIDAIAPGTIVGYATNLGPKTREALKKFTKENHSLGVDSDLAYNLILQRREFIMQIVKKDSTQKGNLDGWINRCNALRKLINDQSYTFACGRD